MAPLFADMFTPILSRLSTAVLLCRSHDRDLRLQLERAAHYDPLTDLPNRVQFVASLRSAITEAERLSLSLAVVSLDLDEFGRLNATLGENVCNGLLVALGQRLNDGVPRNGVVARLAGDEFMVMLKPIPCAHGTKSTARSPPFWPAWPNRSISTASPSRRPAAPGSRCFRPTPPTPRLCREPLRPSMPNTRRAVRFALRRRTRTTEPASAMPRRARWPPRSMPANSWFNYQPQVNLPSGRVEGFEALLRWEHPQRGLLFPGSFLGRWWKKQRDHDAHRTLGHAQGAGPGRRLAAAWHRRAHRRQYRRLPYWAAYPQFRRRRPRRLGGGSPKRAVDAGNRNPGILGHREFRPSPRRDRPMPRLGS